MAELSMGVAQNLFDGYHAQDGLAKMPDVCDPGKACREEIYEASRIKIRDMWA